MGFKEFFERRKEAKREKLERQFREAKVERVRLQVEKGKSRRAEDKQRFIEQVRRQEFRQSSAGKTLKKLRKTAARVGKVGEASARQAKRFVQQQSRKGSLTRRGIAGLEREGRTFLSKRKARKGLGRRRVIIRQEPARPTPQKRPVSKPQTTTMFDPMGRPSNDKKKKVGGIELF